MPAALDTSIEHVVDVSGARFLLRRSSADECIIRSDYQQGRFFSPSYCPSAHDIIIDAGAHIGVFAILAAMRAPAGKVIALEPEASNFDLLLRNVALNEASNVVPFRAALGGADCQTKLYLGENTWDHSVDAATVPDPQLWTEVATITIETLLTREAIERVDYLKMNIEGAEYGVVQSTPIAILRRINHMLIEFHPSNEGTGDGLGRVLVDAGFEVELVQSSDEPGKGWIFARLA